MIMRFIVVIIFDKFKVCICIFISVCVCIHRVITRPYFVEVFGLPDHPMLADVNAVLRQSSGEKYV